MINLGDVYLFFAATALGWLTGKIVWEEREGKSMAEMVGMIIFVPILILCGIVALWSLCHLTL